MTFREIRQTIYRCLFRTTPGCSRACLLTVSHRILLTIQDNSLKFFKLLHLILKEKNNMNVHLLNLGCVRNLVDSELMMGRLADAGCRIVSEASDAEVIIVNTCSFIEAAINESVDTILELAMLKKSGTCRRLIVAGCLPERFGQDIAAALPEVDLFLGTGAFETIADAVRSDSEPRCLLPAPESACLPVAHAPRMRTLPHLAYLKIAEGCNSHCTYCIIPKLRGKQRSRPICDILEEARMLIGSGVKELILVAQETTNYGRDLSGTADISMLSDRIAELSEEVRIRILYGHPESLDESFIRTVASHRNICSYYDVPIQHASDSILKRMGRHYSQKDLYRIFENIRTWDPEAVLRTTVIVGFPGETDKDTDELMKFIEDVRFDHLGAFIYSDAEDLPSHRLKHHVPKQIAKKRHNRLMKQQRKISLKNNEKYLGRTLTVLTEESPEPGVFIGRTAFQAPEVDGITYIRADKLKIGEFAQVKITDTLEYDLIGETDE